MPPRWRFKRDVKHCVSILQEQQSGIVLMSPDQLGKMFVVNQMVPDIQKWLQTAMPCAHLNGRRSCCDWTCTAAPWPCASTRTGALLQRCALLVQVLTLSTFVGQFHVTSCLCVLMMLYTSTAGCALLLHGHVPRPIQVRCCSVVHCLSRWIRCQHDNIEGCVYAIMIVIMLHTGTAGRAVHLNGRASVCL
jgi:hypothetical protein